MDCLKNRIAFDNIYFKVEYYYFQKCKMYRVRSCDIVKYFLNLTMFTQRLYVRLIKQMEIWNEKVILRLCRRRIVLLPSSPVRMHGETERPETLREQLA